MARQLAYLLFAGCTIAVCLNIASKHHLSKITAFVLGLFFPIIALPMYYFWGKKLDKKLTTT